ncbi:hypothetical protein Tco_1369783 [Tanacetum coccineum]
MFHVSILQPFVGDNAQEVTDLPEEVEDGRPIEQHDATWEGLSEFQSAYPDYDLGDTVSFEEKGNDTPRADTRTRRIGPRRTTRVSKSLSHDRIRVIEVRVYLGSPSSIARVASNAINARRLPLDLLVYSLVRPLMTTTVVNNSVFRSFFEKQKLTGPNFIDRYRNLRIVLSVEDKLPFLEQPMHAMPVPPVGQVFPLDVLNTHSAWVKASKEIELLQTVQKFHACKQEEGQSLSSYVLKMKSYIDNLERLNHAMTQNLAVGLILVSLRKEYDSFVQNYNMHGMGKTVTELHAMLKLHEQTLPQKDVALALHAIRAGRIQKNQKKKPHKAAEGNQGK